MNYFLHQKPVIEQLCLLLHINIDARKSTMRSLFLVSRKFFHAFSRETPLRNVVKARQLLSCEKICLRIMRFPDYIPPHWGRCVCEEPWCQPRHIHPWLRSNSSISRSAILRLAAAEGRLYVLQWLHDSKESLKWSPDIMDTAARFGHLNVVKWLHENRKEGCTTEAVDGAVRNGKYDVVQWLLENRSEGFTHQRLSWTDDPRMLALMRRHRNKLV